jgi:hypothetical protein
MRWERKHDTPRAQESRVEDTIKEVKNLQLNDYPALPRKTPVPTATPMKGRVTYAALASNWAEQVKENEEKAKKAAEEEEVLRQIREKKNEPNVVVRQQFVAKKKADSDDDLEVDIGCHESDHSDVVESSDPEEEVVEEEEEEEVVEDPDAFWTQKKHKGDMW